MLLNFTFTNKKYMHKSILLLALGVFLSASVTANACDKDKASAGSCCTKGKHAKVCMTKEGKDCTKDAKCMKAMKTSKTSKTAIKKDATKS